MKQQNLFEEKRAINGMFYRSFELNRTALNEKDRETELSFSSEEPIKRWFGDEILLHGEKNMDLTRLERTGSLLFGHNPWELKNIIGPIKRAWLDKEEKKGRAMVGFDEDEDGNKAMSKVKNGSLKGVSIAYNIKKARQLFENEEWTDPGSGRNFNGPALIAELWEPVEISLTPVPADITVGVGREATRSLEGIDITTINRTKEDGMEKEEITKLFNEMFEQRGKIPTVDEIVAQVKQVMGAESKPKLNITVEQLQDLSARAAAVNDDLFKKVVNEAMAGKTEPELLRMINDEMLRKPDAHHTDGTGDDLDAGIQKETTYKSVADMPDDVFLRSLKP